MTASREGQQVDTLPVQIYGTFGSIIKKVAVDTDGHLQVDILSGGAGGGGTQYNEDDAHTSGDTGTLALVVRQDTAASLCGADSDYSGLIVDSTGRLWCNVSNTVAVSGTFWQDTQPISAASLPLPTGAATAALQLPDGHNVTVDNASIAVTGTFWQATQPISAVSLPLPTGAATAALQLPDGHNVTVDNASIAVTGTFWQATQPISAVSLPLPTGAATAAKQLPDGHSVEATQATASDLKSQVEGTNSQGAAAPNPVMVGGKDLSGNNNAFTSYTTGSFNSMPTILAKSDGSAIADIQNSALTVTGDEAHDAADAGNPIKVGGRATDYHPNAEGAQGDSEVAEDDRVNTAHNLQGQIIEGVNSRYYMGDAELDGTYQAAGTSTRTSSVLECWNYRRATVGFALDSTGTPTDITIEVFISPDNTHWSKLTNGALGSWIYDDQVCASEIEEAYTFDICAGYIKVVITSTGGDASNYFTVDDSYIYLGN